MPGAAAGNVAFSLLLGLGAVAATTVARRVRGQGRSFDLLHALVWLHPWQRELWHAAGAGGLLGVGLAGSAVVLAIDPTLRALLSRASAVWRANSLERKLAFAVSASFAFGVWLLNIASTETKAYLELDPSWQAAAMRHTENGSRAGVDWVFTYGPLGIFDVGIFSERLFWTQRLAYDFLFKGTVALVFGWWCWRSSNWFERALIVSAALLFPNGPDDHAELSIALIALSWMACRRSATRAAWGWLALACALVWTFGVVKFTYFVLGAFALLCLAASLALRPSPTTNEDASARGRSALFAALLAVALLAAVWVGIGQRATDFGTWLFNSWQVATGYGKTMATAVEGAQLRAAALATIAAFGARWWPYLRRRPSREDFAFEAIVAATAFMGFKTSFTRHGGAMSFFHIVACVALLPRREPGPSTQQRERRPAWRSWPQAAALLVALGGDPTVRESPPVAWTTQLESTVQWLRVHWRTVRHPQAWIDRVRGEEESQARVMRESHAKSVIGDRSVDVVTTMQALAVYGGFRWRPRPVIQGYTAYTTHLNELNRSFFASPDAPDCVMFAPDSLDGRFPPLEDGGAGLEVFRRYQPIGFDLGHVLFERRDRSPAEPPTRTVLFDGQLEIGQAFDLSAYEAESLLLELDLRLNKWGEAMTLLLGAPYARMRTQLEDGSQPEWRIVPDVARAGMLVRPFFENAWSVARHYSGQGCDRIRSIAVVVPYGWSRYFQTPVRLRVIEAKDLSWPQVPALWSQALAPFIDIRGGAKIDLQSMPNPSTSWLRGEEFLHLHGPAELNFDVPSGDWRLLGQYALDPVSAQHCPDADGIVVRVRWRDAEREQVLFEDEVRFDRPEDREEQLQRMPAWLDVRLAAAQKGTLSLEFDSQADSGCDWCLVRSILLTPEPVEAR